MRPFLIIALYFFAYAYGSQNVLNGENGSGLPKGGPRSMEETNSSSSTAVDLLQDIYKECVQEGSFTCVKPKVLAFLSTSMGKDKIKITRDLTIVRSFSAEAPTSVSVDEVNGIQNVDESEKKETLKLLALDKLEDFLSNHELRIRIPKEITSGQLPPYVPSILTKNLPDEIKLPLVGGEDQFASRSKKLLKKAVMPFLLGLKFKATTLVPLAFALIALKTWKAFTLALLSIVLSGAMVIYKFTKPKVSYEVVHYPQPVPVYQEHAHVPYGHEYGHPEYGQTAHGRQLSSHHLAYNAHVQDQS